MSPRLHNQCFDESAGNNSYLPTKHISLGTGRLTEEGDNVVFFSPSCHSQKGSASSSTPREIDRGTVKPSICKLEASKTGCDSINKCIDSTLIENVETIKPSLYMRVTDIAKDILHIHHAENKTHQIHPNYVHALKPSPNYNIEQKESELFIALDSKSETPSPICFHAVEELKKKSLAFMSSRNGWVPHAKNSLHDAEDWFQIAIHGNDDGGPLSLKPNVIQSLSKDVICWTKSTTDCPLAIRTMGILPHSASVVYDLILDSNRTKEINQYSAGRKDLWLLQSSSECIMKVVKGGNLPPLRKKPVPFVTFFRGDQTCKDGRRYLVTTRTANLVDDQGNWDGTKFLSEIKMGSNIIMDIDGDVNRCLFISSIEATSPLPVMVAKKVGLKGGISFINGLRSCLSS